MLTEYLHGQDLDVHDLLPELLAGCRVVVVGSIVGVQEPGGTVTVSLPLPWAVLHPSGHYINQAGGGGCGGWGGGGWFRAHHNCTRNVGREEVVGHSFFFLLYSYKGLDVIEHYTDI